MGGEAFVHAQLCAFPGLRHLHAAGRQGIARSDDVVGESHQRRAGFAQGQICLADYAGVTVAGVVRQIWVGRGSHYRCAELQTAARLDRRIKRYRQR